MAKKLSAEEYLPLTESTYYILLALTEPRHGYAIMQFAEEISEGKVKIGPGTLYGAINKLLKEKIILPWEDPTTDNDRRKCYTLTSLGKELLQLEYQRLTRLVKDGKNIVSP